MLGTILVTNEVVKECKKRKK